MFLGMQFWINLYRLTPMLTCAKLKRKPNKAINADVKRPLCCQDLILPDQSCVLRSVTVCDSAMLFPPRWIEDYQQYHGGLTVWKKDVDGWTLITSRKLDQLDSVQQLGELKVPPGNRLEKLSGNRKTEFSIRINEQFRICFIWGEAGPANVEVTDYH